MKTPQEEAEEMKVKASSFYHTLGMTVRDSIKESIPLSELIAVASAAAKVDLTDSECTCGTDPERSCRYCGYFISLDKALQALRATGKVEL